MAEILKKTAQRINFGKIKLPDEQPDLLDIQLETYRDFIQLETTPENRYKEGLYQVFSENFPISDTRNSALALINLDDAALFFRVEGPTGVQLRLSDVHQARRVAAELAQSMGPALTVRDWTRTNRNWFDAVQIEKRLMFIILTLIVAVAAFNLVSTLVMTVTDKRADIAILRTLGASPRSIMSVFMVQGAAAGIIGTLGGVAFGLLIAFNIDVIVPAIERALGVAFLPGSIYLISRMPSEPLMSDIAPIAVISLLLAFAATLYPSWRASRVNPAEALRYE
jgi:lipoprotein-releasing system permease protein